MGTATDFFALIGFVSLFALASLGVCVIVAALRS